MAGATAGHFLVDRKKAGDAERQALRLVALTAGSILADDYRVEAFKDVPAPKGVSADVAAQLSSSGFKVLEGDKRVVCEIWPAKTWTAKADFDSVRIAAIRFRW